LVLPSFIVITIVRTIYKCLIKESSDIFITVEAGASTVGGMRGEVNSYFGGGSIKWERIINGKCLGWYW